MRDVRAAGFECDSLAAAAERVGVPDIEALLAGKPRLAAAWDRGRFLRQVRTVGLKGIVAEEADRFFEPALGRGELCEKLKRDRALHDVWTSAALEAKLAVREGLIQRARRGEADVKVMELYERLLLDGPEAGNGGQIDWHDLTSTQLEKATGIARIQWHRWEEKNGCPRKANRRYSLPAVIAWLREHEATGGIRLEKGMDPLRAKKVEEKELDLAERRHVLLRRDEVLAGILMRYQRLGQARQRVPDLVLQIHEQDKEHIERVLTDFCDELCQLQISELGELYLPPEAATLFDQILAVLPKTAEDTGTTENGTD